ncbi:MULTISPECIES: urea ABC transporter permease subunit UrtC [Clostridium]|uniref:Urea ABC transporter permease subunit UrtC n=2 Tax=Clostridium TaxID=1485 RepID=A0A1S9N5T7_CLOBE|nr:MULTISPECIES: urea ABC transporter permease subunit UrtC [Clostridium]EKQ54850.1 MAG: urea ABC transporter, permease protein UrtC [Clostridium sp. Maddingley MBC34-26]MZK51555.1 urea ABC transporter permease subunit UrtC [Clostridium beijerinckii]MZK59830.1 urea ABC transporter permease subunit UrtC [Clostridium beijerinckii]MZK70115.1 urea ABC transporter permease subunit UrtC [Clostridium beijerinckii]MZK75358.1 urea ABC transporter permease subunit UrtC [Clostridium beijerinckii]
MILSKKLDWKTIIAIIIFIFLATAPIYMTMFRINLLGKYMCFAIVAIGLDMIWGYTGILSLGHGVYFGIGAYCMAMYLKLEAAHGGLPDFMQWSGVEKLPFFWKPFSNAAFSMTAIAVVPVILAVIIGYLTFVNRIKGVYFSILSQALAMILSVLLIGMQSYTGGSNGLTNFSTIFGRNINSNLTKFVLFYITLIFLAAIFILCKFLINRRVGKIFIAIRDGENRARFTGYNPANYKVFVYALSAFIAGIAGALYVTQVGIISPAEVGVTPSVEMIIWVAIGGKGTLVGPIIGALSINGIKTIVSENFPDIWSYFIGVVFVVVILWLPGGIISLKDVSTKLKKKLRKKKQEQEQPITV